MMTRSKELWETSLPHVSIDCVVFGFDKGQLHVLLLQTKGDEGWLLPGGYILKEETLEDAAARILYDRSHAGKLFLQQFGVFGDAQRSQAYFRDFPDTLWHKQRFVTIGYYALVELGRVHPEPDEFSAACTWHPVDQLPRLFMDHATIISKALDTLREQLAIKPVGYNLMPEEFTLPELQSLYEAILGRKLNRGNFYRKIMRYGILVQLPHQRTGKAHKSPNLYRFDLDSYQQALVAGQDWI